MKKGERILIKAEAYGFRCPDGFRDEIIKKLNSKKFKEQYIKTN